MTSADWRALLWSVLTLVVILVCIWYNTDWWPPFGYP